MKHPIHTVFHERTFIVALTAIFLLTLVLATLSLPIHWDEGWNLCVARTWLEQGHFGCLLEGQLTTARLSTGWLPVLFSKVGFELFGMSILGGRIIIALHAFIAFLGVFLLAKRTINTRAAVLAMSSVLFLSSDPRISLVLLGGIGYAEVLLVAYLAICLLSTLALLKSRSWIASAAWLIPSTFFFALAFLTKIQGQPFLLLGFLVTGCVLITSKNTRIESMKLFFLMSAGYYLARHFPAPLPTPQGVISYSGAGTTGLAAILGINLNIQIRLIVIKYFIPWAWPLLLALAWFGIRLYRERQEFFSATKRAPQQHILLIVYLICIAWIGWFVSLAIDFPRYVAPPVILGSLFLGYYLDTLLRKEQEKKCSSTVRKGIVFCAYLLFFLYASLNTIYLFRYLYEFRDENQEMKDIVQYIHTHSTPEALVETYDTSFFFLLNRPYHYPPDQLNVERLAEKVGKRNGTMKYNWEQYQPEFVIIGPWSKGAFQLYGDVVDTPTYNEALSTQRYTLYQKTPPRARHIKY